MGQGAEFSQTTGRETPGGSHGEEGRISTCKGSRGSQVPGEGWDAKPGKESNAQEGAAPASGFTLPSSFFKGSPLPDWATRDCHRIRVTSHVLTFEISLCQSCVSGCGFSCPPETSLLELT